MGNGKVQLIADDDLPKVEYLAGLGLSMLEISAAMGFKRSTFYARVKDQQGVKEAIDRGRAKANMNVAKSAYSMATSEEHPSMTMFWLRTQAGWVDPDKVDQEKREASEAMSEEDRGKRIKHLLSIREKINQARDVTPKADGDKSEPVTG